MTHSADRAPRTLAAPVRILATAFFLLIAVVGVGCVYRINIQQGNYLDPKAVEQLSVGMTRSQVRYLLGTPMVPNAFDTDRWDYYFYYKHGRTRKAEQAQITVYFEDDKVARIERPRGSAKVATTTPTEKPAEGKEPAEPLPPPPESPSSTAEQLPPPPASPPPESRSSTPEQQPTPESPSSTPEQPLPPPAPEPSEDPPPSPP
jgi:outer membrane protein assembly factor BamE